MSKKISIAILGCGKMGNSMIKYLKDMPEIDKIYGYDVVKEQLDVTMENHKDMAGVTTNLDEILSNEEIKLVFIATANEVHVPLACAAMRAGKAVMTEKPSGITYEDIDELIKVQNETGAFLQVGLECRYSKAYVTAKEIIDSGEIGKLVNVHFTYAMSPYGEFKTLADGTKVKNWRVTKEKVGNMFLEKLCHYIDLVRWWNEGSKIERFVATGFDNVLPYFEIEDNVHISYQFDNGCTSHLNFNMLVANGDNSDMLSGYDVAEQDKDGHKLNYVLTGTEGAIEIDVFQRQLRVYHHPGKAGIAKEKLVRVIEWTAQGDGAPIGEKTYYHDTYSQNRDIVRRVLNGDKPSISIEDAQETMRVCLDFSKATAENKWEIIER